MSPSGTPALLLLRREGIEHRVHGYAPAERHGRARDERPDYGEEAAAALGIPPGRMAKTLIVSTDGRLAAAVVPVDRRLDLKRMAAVCGGRHAELADAAVAERASGSVVGAISPLGLRRPLPTVVDAAVLEHETVLVSAGRRGLQLELAPRDLVRACTGTVAVITRPT